MNNKRFASVVGASALAFGTVVAPAIPVMAAGTTYDGVAGGSVNIQQYLVFNSTSEVPNVTFDDYTIEAGQASTNGSVKIYAGNDADKVTGTPTIGDAVFTKGQTKYSSVQDLVSSGIQVAENKKDPVTLADGQSYAKADVAVDFSGVTFKEPGIYRYQITADVDAVADGTDSDTRYMDVYVNDNGDGTLTVAGYVLHKTTAEVCDAGWDETVLEPRYVCNGCGESFKTEREVGRHMILAERENPDTTCCNYHADDDVKVTIHHDANDDGKSEGFVTTIKTKDLNVATSVSGNQASRDEYFKVTVNLTGASANASYNVDLSKADATTKTNGVNTESHTNPATITTDESGNASVDFWLQNGQSITIDGLTLETSYTVSEDETSLIGSGYTIDATKSGDDDAAVADASVTGKITSDDEDTVNVAFTNSKAGTIPTGVVMAVAPFAVATVLGGAGAATVIMKKKRTE